MFQHFEFNIHQLAERMLELEAEINRLAGARLLAWETKYGGAWPESRKRRYQIVYAPIIPPLLRVVAKGAWSLKLKEDGVCTRRTLKSPRRICCLVH
jgi:hypothetical protein